MFTQEEMCLQIQHGKMELLPELWETVEKLYTLKAYKWFTARADIARAHGVELEDVIQQAWFAFLQSVAAYDPANGLPFLSLIEYPFRKECAALLGQRSAQGRFEPLNHCASLDKETDTEDGDGGTLGDFIPDPAALEFVDALDAQSVAELIRAEVERLPMPERDVIARYYLHGETLKTIADAAGKSIERARQIRDRGLKMLRKSRTLRELWAETHHAEQQRALEKQQQRDEPGKALRAADYMQAICGGDTWIDRAMRHARELGRQRIAAGGEWSRDDQIAAVLDYLHRDGTGTATDDQSEDAAAAFTA